LMLRESILELKRLLLEACYVHDLK
jgi:hypothetical protein